MLGHIGRERHGAAIAADGNGGVVPAATCHLHSRPRARPIRGQIVCHTIENSSFGTVAALATGVLVVEWKDLIHSSCRHIVQDDRNCTTSRRPGLRLEGGRPPCNALVVVKAQSTVRKPFGAVLLRRRMDIAPLRSVRIRPVMEERNINSTA